MVDLLYCWNLLSYRTALHSDICNVQEETFILLLPVCLLLCRDAGRDFLNYDLNKAHIPPSKTILGVT